MTIHWKAVEQYFTVVLFCLFGVWPACYFGKFINFGLGTARIEKVNLTVYPHGRHYQFNKALPGDFPGLIFVLKGNINS